MVSCARCNAKLGLRKVEPRPDWEIGGKVCTECNRHICKNTSYYETQYKENEPDFPKQKGILAIQNFDEKRRVLFIAKDKILFEIPLLSIQKIDGMNYAEESIKKKVTTLGLKDKSTSKHLQITFVGDNGIYSPIFHVKDFESVSDSINLHIQKYYEELENITPPQLMIDAIKHAREIQFEDLGMSKKLIDNSNEIKKIKKYMDQDERILYITRQDSEKQARSADNASIIFATDKRILIRNISSLGMKSLIEEMPYDDIISLKLQEGNLSSTVIFNGVGFAEINTVSQVSMQRAWGIEKETVIDSMPKKDAKEFVDILREQIKKNGINNLEFTHITN